MIGASSMLIQQWISYHVKTLKANEVISGSDIRLVWRRESLLIWLNGRTAETDLLFGMKAALKQETLRQCFSITLNSVIAQKGTGG